MNIAPPITWFFMLYTFSVMAIAVFLIRMYANRFCDLKANVHAIHLCIDLIDSSLEDDSVTKEEFVALVKRVLVTLARIR